MKPFVISLLAILAFVFLLNAQNGPQFEVATLKLSAPVQPGVPLNITFGVIRNGSTVTLTNVTLAECIQFAYGIVSDAQIVGPDWIKSRDVRFDIVGQAEFDTPHDTLRVMIQNLLANRLKLALHHEDRQLPFLALLVANNGPKLSSTRGPTVPLSKLAPAQDDGDRPAQVPGRIVSVMPMTILATLLSRFERETVIDLTGLNGPFPVVLQWTPDSIRGRTTQDGTAPLFNAEPANLDRPYPSLNAALQEQLGLRLESRRGPLDVLVVDHAERVPADN
jgi:uncharacterized protein (TIGR03435 family)